MHSSLPEGSNRAVLGAPEVRTQLRCFNRLCLVQPQGFTDISLCLSFLIPSMGMMVYSPGIQRDDRQGTQDGAGGVSCPYTSYRSILCSALSPLQCQQVLFSERNPRMSWVQVNGPELAIEVQWSPALWTRRVQWHPLTHAILHGSWSGPISA